MINKVWAEIVSRPLLALVIGYVATGLVSGVVAVYHENREEIDKALDNRTKFVRSIADKLRATEADAPFDAERWTRDGEIAARLYGDAPTESAAS